MDLSDIAAITGMPGLFKIAARRNDGLIVTSLLDNKTQFVSGRTHLFTTLDNITIYTSDEPATLKEVLASIKAKEAGNPLPDGKDEAKVKSWLEVVLPTYDKEKVYVSDMKKLIKWYGILNEQKLIEELTSDKAAETASEATEESSEKKETKKEKEPKTKEAKTKAGKKTVSNKANTKPVPAAKKITTPRKAS
jgi:hypothetical protein